MMAMDRRTIMRGGAMGVAALAMDRWALVGTAHAAYPVTMTDAQWRKKLIEGQYKVLRQAATEAPGTSPLLKEHRKGVFACAGCAQKLFSSTTKYDSGTGWPSFWQPLARAVATSTDNELGFARTEVHCTRCGGHLGHVFDDGPRPTGKRYCMNGVALKFLAGPTA